MIESRIASWSQVSAGVKLIISQETKRYNVIFLDDYISEDGFEGTFLNCETGKRLIYHFTIHRKVKKLGRRNLYCTSRDAGPEIYKDPTAKLGKEAVDSHVFERFEELGKCGYQRWPVNIGDCGTPYYHCITVDKGKKFFIHNSE